MKIRRKLREAVLKSLYATEVSGDKLESIITYTLKPLVNGIVKSIDKKDSQEGYKESDAINFAEKLYLKTINQEELLDAEINKHVENWDINRLAVLDKLILRMAICEMIDFEEVPAKVTINEAIEIAKKYSTEKSGRFVNGILDSAYQSMKKEGKIKKTGRGLIDETLNNTQEDQ
ncbi:MAG TPA: transcription antitermination factor NusB [Balneolales bacterium]|nr:transcription antitermination factor NusB [Balneolales bacterium]